MNEEDKTNYLKLNKPIYEIVLVYTSKPISGEFKYKKSYQKTSKSLIPEFKPKKAYKFSILYFRNEASIELLERFTYEALKSIFTFKIKSQLTLNIDEIEVTDKISGYQKTYNGYPLTGGFVPFSSPSLDSKFKSYRGNDFDFLVPLISGG